MFSLNDTSLTFFILATLLELLIQSNHHLLSRGIPHQNQQSSTMKTRQSGCLRKFWIYDIQDWVIIFNTRFADLIVIVILSDIIQMIMNFKTHLKFYMNIMHNISTNQIYNLLNWSWFIISQQRQAEKKSETQSQRLSQFTTSFIVNLTLRKWFLSFKNKTCA